MASLDARIRVLQQMHDRPIRRSRLVELGLATPELTAPYICNSPTAKAWRTPPQSLERLRRPLIAAELNLSGPPIRWEHPRLRDLIQPLSTAQVGVLSSVGLMPLAQRAQLSLHKISVISSESDDFQRRISSLERDQYASFRLDQDGAPVEDRGFDHWQLNALPQLPEPDPWNPVRPKHRYFNVRLPWGVTFRDLDTALTKSLASARVDLWMETARGQDHCRKLNVDHRTLQRFTNYDMGGTRPYLRQALEIVNFMPQHQAFLLGLVIEETVLSLSGWTGPRRWW